MRSLFFVLLTGLFVSYIPTTLSEDFKTSSTKPIPEKTVEKKSTSQLLYEKMKLAAVLKFEAFSQALEGYNLLHPKKDGILTVIDFTLPSTAKRMVVLDMKNEKVLFHTIVSHGKNSGDNFATSFSNRHGSYQSSLGFYETQNTYQGGNGYSLVLNGLEKGINDQAKARAVVVHGADYCSESMIKATGRLGRSYGCPALPRALAKPIINTIKDGTLLFIYAENEDYLAKTKVLSPLAQRGVLAQSGELTNENELLN